MVETDLFVRGSDLGPLVAVVPVGERAFQSFCQASLIPPRLHLYDISCFKSKWKKTELLLGEFWVHRGNEMRPHSPPPHPDTAWPPSTEGLQGRSGSGC